MPNNWKTYKLGEFAGLKKVSIRPDRFNGEDYIGLEHITQGTFLLDGLGKAEDVESNKYKFSAGDILYGKIRPYFKKAYRPMFSGICSTDILVIQTKKPDIVSQGYLYQIIKTQFFTDKAVETSSGTKMPRADWNSLEQVEINIPPLPEQKAIASILSSLDDKIELNLQMNKTLEEMAMTLYKHWFVDFGPFQEGKFVESELGPIPEGWEVKRLDEVAKVNANSIKKTNEPSEISYIDIASVNSGWVAEIQSILYSEAPSRAKRIVTDGDIVWSTVRPNRKSRFLALGMGENTIASTGFAVLTPNKLPYSYIYPYSCTEEFVDYLVSRATGSSYPAVTGKVFEEAKILHPTKNKVNEYDALCRPFFIQYSMNTLENQTLTNLRDTLLPKLISGEVRVKEAEKTVAEVL